MARKRSSKQPVGHKYGNYNYLPYNIDSANRSCLSSLKRRVRSERQAAGKIGPRGYRMSKRKKLQSDRRAQLAKRQCPVCRHVASGCSYPKQGRPGCLVPSAPVPRPMAAVKLWARLLGRDVV